MISNVNDFGKYKRAKVIVKELESALKVINLSLRGLTPYRKYTTMTETLLCLKDSKDILTIHLDHQKLILKNKGKIIEES